MASPQETFNADLERANAALQRLGAVVTYPDGFVGIDPTKAPEDLLRHYNRLTQYGYANGLLGGGSDEPA